MVLLEGIIDPKRRRHASIIYEVLGASDFEIIDRGPLRMEGVKLTFAEAASGAFFAHGSI